MRFAWVVGLMAVVCGTGMGCQNAVDDENHRLYTQNQQLQQKIDELQNQPTPVAAAPTGDDAAAMAKLKSDNQRLQDQLAAMQAAGPTTAPMAVTGLEGLDTAVDPAAGTITVTLQGDVLFDSGKADLKDSAKASLDQVAAALQKQYSGKQIRVEGHTDSDPITRSKDLWADNLDLSLERAAQVTRYLEKDGMDAKRITTSGFGESRPKGADKAANRRVEIVVVMR